VVAVEHIGPVLTRHQGYAPPEGGLKSRRSVQCVDNDALPGQRLTPDTLVVETAHRRWDFRMQSPRELNDESFGSTGVQPQHHLQNTRAHAHS
jgi:hypothetical protein